MSDSGSQAQGKAAFGVPDNHFLCLAVDLLKGLELQSRERGHTTLASLVDVAKTEAENALRTDVKRMLDASHETKLVSLVKAIRIQMTRATAVTPIAAAARSRLLGRTLVQAEAEQLAEPDEKNPPH